MPKKQTTAAKKARAAQRDGAKYTQALRDTEPAGAELAAIRRTAAEHIFHSPDRVLTAPAERILTEAGASEGADRLHAALDEAGIDLSPELDALAERTATAEFGPHEVHDAPACGKQLDPWGEFPDTCARPPHADGEQCSKNRDFDQAAWQHRVTAEWAAAEARWNALSPDQQAEAKRLQWEEEYDDGRTASDDYEDARAYKWMD